jgi:hypothetical protein
LGKTIAYDAEARRLGAIETLVERTVDRNRSTITHTVVNFDPRPDVAHQVFRVVFRIDGDRFQVREKGGAFSGRGRLFGPRWEWNEWESESRLAQGGRVVSRGTLGDEGLAVEKRFFDENGSAKMTFRQELQPIDSATCESRLEEATR